MATYLELAEIQSDPQWNDLLSRIRIACTINATEIINLPTPTAEALAWAKATIKNPRQAGDDVAYYVVAVNATATIAQIYSADDVAVKANVDSAISAMIGG